MDKKLPSRKHTRLKNYDYSTTGAYFVTICTQDRKCFLSHIVGRGFTPAEIGEIKYTKYGEIAKEQLLLLEKRYSCLRIDQYVIMPNHIHILFLLDKETAGASPCPTIMDIVCAYKSLTTRKCKKAGFTDKLFQNSFYEHIIRNTNDYEEICKYISDNPSSWVFDELYTE